MTSRLCIVVLCIPFVFAFAARGQDCLDYGDWFPASAPAAGALLAQGTSEAVLRVDDRLYLGTSSGLFCFDIADPMAPILLGRTTDPTEFMAHDGNYIYTATSGDLSVRVIDFSDPARPITVSMLSFAEVASGITALLVKGEYLYVAGYLVLTGSVSVVNIADPATPRIVAVSYSTHVIAGWAYHGETLFAIGTIEDTGIGFVTAFDLVDYTQLVPLCTLSANAILRDFEFEGDVCYLAASGLGIKLIDISVPSHLRWLGTVPSVVASRSLARDGDHLFSACFVDALMFDGLDVVDISDPSRPVRVGHAMFSDNSPDLAAAAGVVYRTSSRGTMELYDVQNPAEPRLADWARLRGVDNQALAVAVSDPHVFVGTLSGIDVVDISDPKSMVVVGRIPLEASVNALQCQGDILYWAGGGTLRTYDVANPLAIEARGSLTQAGAFRSFAVAGSYLYATIGGAAMAVVDVADPTDPYLRATVAGAAINGTIAAQGDLVGAASVSGEVRFYDVSDPDAPVLRSSIATGAYLTDIAIDGGYAYLTTEWSGEFLVVDLSDPVAPYVCGRVPREFDDQAVTVQAPFAYVLTKGGWLHVVDVSDPRSPAVVGVVESLGNGNDMASDGTYLVSAMRNGGLSLAWPACPPLLATETTRATGLALGLTPNPFNPMTTISFALDRAQDVRVVVYDVAGRLVDVLAEGVLPAGTHHVAWRGAAGDGRALPSGNYLFAVRTEQGAQVRRGSLIR